MKNHFKHLLVTFFCILLGSTFVGCGNNNEEKNDPYLKEAQSLIRAAIEEHYEGDSISYINETWGKPHKNEFKDTTVEEDELGGHTKAFFDHHYMFSVEFFVIDDEHNVNYEQVQFQYYVKDEIKYLNDNALFSYPIIQRIMDGKCKGSYGYLTNNFSLYGEKTFDIHTFYYYGEQGHYEQYKGDDISQITETAYSVTIKLTREGGEVSDICFYEDFDGVVEFPETIGGAPILKANLNYHLANNTSNLNVSPSLHISKWIKEISYGPYHDFDKNMSIINHYENITVDTNNKNYYSGENGGCIISSDKHELLVIGNACTTIPQTVVSINSNAYSYYDQIVEVEIPSHITSVTFTNCSSLKRIYLNGATAVVSNCPNLEYIVTNSRSNSGWARSIVNCPKFQTIYIKLDEGDTLITLVYEIYEDVKSYYAIYSEIDPSNLEKPEGFDDAYSLGFEAWKAQFKWWHYDTDGVTPVLW